MKKKMLTEMAILSVIAIAVFILSTRQVTDIVSIWNQNDEFGVWQGGAWVLGLDWSEVVSTNGYYGYGYGFILALFIKIFGHDTVLMTQAAIYFQALLHIICIFIAWHCIRQLFPTLPIVPRIIAASVCTLSIPDLFYVYMFFSECLLRFIVWLIFGIVVSYCSHKRWYKILFVNLLSIYAFSIHQRCILLIAMAFMLSLYEVAAYLKSNRVNKKIVIIIILMTIITGLFYFIEYRCAQDSYITTLYSVNGSSVGGNLLSERGYTVKSILRDIVFNKETHIIALQNMLGFIYYICAFDCGFTAFGFILCFRKMKDVFSEKGHNIMPYLFISIMTLFGILLTVYQMVNKWVYTRVEMMHYGRYCSYLFAPMMMLGIVELLTQASAIIRKNTVYLIAVFLVAGLSIYNVLKTYHITNLFAFANACPGILSVYYEDNPYTATLYHTMIGCLWILLPVLGIVSFDKYTKIKSYIQIGIFIVISFVWINTADKEWRFTHEAQSAYVTQTYDLQNILHGENEFVVFKSFFYGSGLLQYNNLFSKIHVCQSFEEFGKEEDGLLVVSQKGIDEMKYIMSRYTVEYENERYFVWRYMCNEQCNI